MRFMRGSKVEVLSNREVPSGAWRKAEILLGNGHYYRVKYDQPLSDSDDAIVERVSRKVIRPYPPARYIENWVAGDIVEVFDNNSWKISKVLEAVGGDCFFVRLLGSSLEIKVHKSGIRARQSWKDDQWVVIGKVSRCCEDGEAEKLQTEKYYQKPNYQVLDQDLSVKAHGVNDHFPIDDVPSLQVPRKASSGRMKRGSEFCLAHVETLMEAGWKKRAIEKESRCSQLVLEHPLREKVDAVASRQSMLGENLHASFNNRMAAFSEIGSGTGRPNVNGRYFVPTSLEPNYAESSAFCSVASCGSSDCAPILSPHHSVSERNLDTDSQSDDAESSSGREYGTCGFPTKEGLAVEIHKLELHAYRSTMVALYASGSLNWEQEVMLTNLRLTLHISNDEHLSELRAEVAGLRHLGSKGLMMMVGLATCKTCLM